jgi:anaerobic selenocysteine-containing dehydrogenase
MNQSIEIKTLPSVCPLDCPDTCSLAVKVANDQIVEVRGSDACSYTAAKVCTKVTRYYPDLIHGEQRLTQPLKRVGPKGSGQFEAISWEQALELAYQGINQTIAAHGPQSVLPLNYAGPHGELGGGSMASRFFNELGASQLDRGPLCAGTGGMAYRSLYGATPGMPPEQALHSDLIVVWGNNVTVSNLHFMREINKAKQQGAKLIVVDPKRITAATKADLHLAVYPGSDVVLAMALAAELERRDALDMAFIEQWTTGFDAYMQQARQYSVDDVEQLCRISAEQFYQFADLYQTANNVSVSVGVGLERTRNGGSSTRAAFALQALTGNHGRLGAGIIAKSGMLAPKTPNLLEQPERIKAGTRTINIIEVGKKLLDGSMKIPLKALVIFNHNPVAVHPDQGTLIKALKQDEVFSLGIDLVMTDSMALCDVILPAASHFEFDDIYGSYGHNYIQRAEPVIPCVGESLPNTEIFRRLAAKFGFDSDDFKLSDEQLIDAAMDPNNAVFEGKPPSQMPTDKAIAMTTSDGQESVLCLSVMPATNDGKIHLYDAELEAEYGCGVPSYRETERPLPLVLVTPSSDKRSNSTFGHHADSQGQEELEINPADAEARGLADGDKVLAWNDLAEVTFEIRISTDVQPGVVYSPKGTWCCTSDTGLTANALIPVDARTDISSGAVYNDTFIEVRKI